MRGLFKPTVVVHAQCKLYIKIFKKTITQLSYVGTNVFLITTNLQLLQPRHLLLDEAI